MEGSLKEPGKGGRKKAAPKKAQTMKSSKKKTERATPLLPSSWVIVIKNLSLRSVGVLGVAAVIALGVALAGYSPQDPTWNVEAADPVTNPLGPMGANIADMLMQTLGLAAWALLLPPLLWSQKVMRLKWLPQFWVNVAMLPIGVVMVALMVSVYPPTADFPVQAGYGGALGQLFYGQLVSMTADLALPAWIYLLVFLVLGLPLYAVSFGLNKAEWQTTGRVTGRVLVWTVRQPIVALVWAFGSIRRAALERADRAAEDEPTPKREARRAKTRHEPSFGPAAQEGPDSDSPPWEDEASAIPVTVAAPPVKDRAKTAKGKRERKEKQPSLPILMGYQLPTLDLLSPPPAAHDMDRESKESLQQNALVLSEVLEDFSVSGDIRDVRPGPVVTLYELEPARGTKSARVIGLADDIARSMSAVSARIAVVPGRNRIGVELPNASRETVFLRELLASRDFESSRSKLAIALGKDIGGAPVVVDLATMPHLLVAGTTGAGKSVGINTMILSMLYKHAPETLRLIMIDPKMLELSVYDDIPHLLTPVVTDAKKAVVALKWAVREMEERYKKMSLLKVRNLAAFNKKVEDAKARGEVLTHSVQTGYDKETSEPIIEEEVLEFDPLPFIVVVIDEMADLMVVAGKDVEQTVQRLAQMARAAGIHLIMATQRPSVDVITGTIKANFPTRISFQVTSKIDSRTILNEQGAEQLLGKGDMLYMAPGARLMRVHGAFVDDSEVEDVVDHLRRQGKPDYLDEVTEEPPEGFDSPFIPSPSDSGEDTGAATLYDKAVDVVLRDRKASTSYVQRRLGIGYNKAATLIEKMEANGVISAPNHKNQREILVPERDDQL